MRWDAKTFTAAAALVTALSGAIELRVQVGLLASRLDALTAKVDRIEREVAKEYARAD